MNNPKVKNAIKLQEKTNQEIDMYGQATDKTFNKMMKVFDSLTIAEIEIVLAAASGVIESNDMFDDEFEF
jgi:hypothetical protein